MKKILLLLSLLFFAGCSNTNVNIDDGVIRSENGTSIVSDSGLEVMDYNTRVALGLVEGASVVHKFGSSELTTTLSIISQSGTYMTPTTPQLLEFVSDSINDTFLGTGARQITFEITNSSWMREIITIDTNGTTPVQLPKSVLRLDRWFVSSSGTYASPGTTSYVGNLEVRETGGGVTWSNIFNSPITVGQSQIGVYSVAAGKTAYITNKCIFSDTLKVADFYLFFRENSDDVTAPFSGTRRIIERELGVSGGTCIIFPIPKGPIVGPADIGFFGGVSQGTSSASVEFELLLVDTN